MRPLYNIIFGVCPAAVGLLAILELHPERGPQQYGRFRDCYARRINGELVIHLLTRNGGDNRPAHEAVTERMRAHPDFLREFDEPIDSTYLTYEFRVSESKRYRVEHLVHSAPELCIYDEFGLRFKAAERRLTEEPDHPENKRIAEEMRPNIERVHREFQSGQRVAAIIDEELKEWG